MAFINTAALRGAIIERLEGTIGGVRAMPAGEVEADIIDKADDSTKAFRALLRPVFTVEFEIDRHPDSPMGPTSLFLWLVDVKLRCTYNLKGLEPQTVDYGDRKSIAERHADQFAQALSYPGALSVCLNTGDPTGLASGMLVNKSPLYRVINDDPANAIFEIEQSYTGTVQVTAATS